MTPVCATKWERKKGNDSGTLDRFSYDRDQESFTRFRVCARRSHRRDKDVQELEPDAVRVLVVITRTSTGARLSGWARVTWRNAN